MKLDTFLDPFKEFIRRKSGRSAQEEVYFSGGSPNASPGYHEHYWNSDRHATGVFSNAHDFVVNNPVFGQVTNTMIATGKTVLEILHPHTMPDAAMDSSARDPPPRCHPGTCGRIANRIDNWLDDLDRDSELLWLYGSAGSGKSAIAQSFAEFCMEQQRLGAAYFFSRPNLRDKVETVIPTLAYQLAFHCQAYHSMVSECLSNDPQLLHKALSVQFNQLVIDPFTRLQEQNHESVRKPFLVILDGLDECKGVKAQCDFIRMIAEHVRSRRKFPILWLICSRPEPHIVQTFSRIPEYTREKLLLDKEYHKDVERVVRSKFARFKDQYPHYIPSSWPSDEQLNKFIRMFSGPFIVASVALNYIGDPEVGEPAKRLTQLISFIEHRCPCHSERVASPLETLDLLYTRILDEIPADTLPTTMHILSFLVSTHLQHLPVQALCNILRFDQNTFYAALRKLYSIADIPPPEDALERGIIFHHASFRDYLIDSSRSGKYNINHDSALFETAKILLSWHQLDVSLFHRSDRGIKFDLAHRHACLPDLSWTSSTHDQETVSRIIASYASYQIVYPFLLLSMNHLRDDALLAEVYSTDFRCMYENVAALVINWIYSQDPSSTMIRTTPSSEIDSRLLKHLELLTGENPNVRPVPSLPLIRGNGAIRFVEYAFLGQGTQTLLIVVVASDSGDHWQSVQLNADAPPSQDDLESFQRTLDYLGFSRRDRENTKDKTPKCPGITIKLRRVR